VFRSGEGSNCDLWCRVVWQVNSNVSDVYHASVASIDLSKVGKIFTCINQPLSQCGSLLP
jgi:hypothetical protein